MVACTVHYDLDFGLVMRFGGEYTDEWRDVDAILTSIEPYVSEDDNEHIRRILMKRCLAKCVWEEPAKNKEKFICRGNNPSIKAHCDVVKENLNREEHNYHIMPFPGWMYRGSPYTHHTRDTIIVKRGKKARLIWDGTTK